MATKFLELIDDEIAHAKAGKNAYCFLKMNSLEDAPMIDKLREAAAAGVEIRLIVRGICRLVPGPDENIEIISIIDRFLEHARIYIFGGGDAEKVYFGSADWMGRNLYRRVEVITPVIDPLLRLEVRRLMDIQWRDNTKARIISRQRLNQYRVRKDQDPEFRAQTDIYDYYKRREQMV